MDSMKYELLVRRAFGIEDGGLVTRWGDPAGLADAGYIASTNERMFQQAKAAAIYAMSIFQHKLEKMGKMKEYESAQIHIENIIAAHDKNSCLDIIEDFFNTIIQTNFPVRKV